MNDLQNIDKDFYLSHIKIYKLIYLVHISCSQITAELRLAPAVVWKGVLQVDWQL